MKKTFTALAVTLALTGCESAEDKARKASVANSILEYSLDNCDMQEEYPEGDSYRNRLKEVLMRTKTKALDVIKEREILVCLDRRIATTEKEFFDRRPHAFFYPETKTISLYDSGNSTKTRSFLETTASSYSDSLLEKFVSNGIFDATTLQQGYHYTTRTKNTTIHHYRWKDGQDLNIVQNHPELLKPPVNS